MQSVRIPESNRLRTSIIVFSRRTPGVIFIARTVLHAPALLPGSELHYNPVVTLWLPKKVSLLIILALFSVPLPGQQVPPPSGARILLLPRKIVSGERATLAVLDFNGKLTPDAQVEFSNGDKVTTDATGRGVFVAPLSGGTISGAIEGRPGRVNSTILTAGEVPSSTLEVVSAPRVASLSDRMEIVGHGFCGDADANHVTIGGNPAFVLASSPAYLAVLAPMEMDPGPSIVQVQCGQKTSAAFAVIFVTLELNTKTSSLAPGEHRSLLVRVRGSSAKINLEARNLAPDVAELAGGTTVRTTSTGGVNNTASFELQGKQHGNFVISIRLLSPLSPPRP